MGLRTVLPPSVGYQFGNPHCALLIVVGLDDPQHDRPRRGGAQRALERHKLQAAEERYEEVREEKVAAMVRQAVVGISRVRQTIATLDSTLLPHPYASAPAHPVLVKLR